MSTVDNSQRHVKHALDFSDLVGGFDRNVYFPFHVDDYLKINESPQLLDGLKDLIITLRIRCQKIAK